MIPNSPALVVAIVHPKRRRHKLQTAQTTNQRWMQNIQPEHRLLMIVENMSTARTSPRSQHYLHCFSDDSHTNHKLNRSAHSPRAYILAGWCTFPTTPRMLAKGRDARWGRLSLGWAPQAWNTLLLQSQPARYSQQALDTYGLTTRIEDWPWNCSTEMPLHHSWGYKTYSLLMVLHNRASFPSIASYRTITASQTTHHWSSKAPR